MTFLAADLAHQAASAATVLASGSSNSTSDISNVAPGLLGFLVVAGLGVALVFLLRSMNKQLRKIGPKPEESGDVAADEAKPQKPLRGLAAHRAALAAGAAGRTEPAAAQAPAPAPASAGAPAEAKQD